MNLGTVWDESFEIPWDIPPEQELPPFNKLGWPLYSECYRAPWQQEAQIAYPPEHYQALAFKCAQPYSPDGIYKIHEGPWPPISKNILIARNPSVPGSDIVTVPVVPQEGIVLTKNMMIGLAVVGAFLLGRR